MTLSCQCAQCRVQRKKWRQSKLLRSWESPQARKLGFKPQPEVPQAAFLLASLPCLPSLSWGQNGLRWNTCRRYCPQLPGHLEGWYVCILVYRDGQSSQVIFGSPVRRACLDRIVALQRGLPNYFGLRWVTKSCRAADFCFFFPCRYYRSQCPSGEMSVAIIFW